MLLGKLWFEIPKQNAWRVYLYRRSITGLSWSTSIILEARRVIQDEALIESYQRPGSIHQHWWSSCSAA